MNDLQHEITIHECGHAVVSMLLGEPAGAAVFAGTGTQSPGGVSGNDSQLGAQPDNDGYTPESLAGIYDNEGMQELLDRATIFAAGDVAVELARITPTLKAWQDHFSIYEMARSFLGETSDYHTERAFQDLAYARARRLLSPNWYKVQAVASALAERGRLSAAEVEQIFTDTKGETEI